MGCTDIRFAAFVLFFLICFGIYERRCKALKGIWCSLFFYLFRGCQHYSPMNNACSACTEMLHGVDPLAYQKQRGPGGPLKKGVHFKRYPLSCLFGWGGETTATQQNCSSPPFMVRFCWCCCCCCWFCCCWVPRTFCCFALGGGDRVAAYVAVAAGVAGAAATAAEAAASAAAAAG